MTCRSPQNLHPNAFDPNSSSRNERSYLVELNTSLQDLISDLGSSGKGRDVLSDGGERELHLLGLGPRDLSLGSVTKNDEVGVGVGLDSLLGGLGDGRVDTTAETGVGGDSDDEGLSSLGGGGLGVLEELWICVKWWEEGREGVRVDTGEEREKREGRRKGGRRSEAWRVMSEEWM
jgi:hypothetical protein